LEATKAGGFACDGSGCTARAGSTLVAVARHPSAFADDCSRARILVASFSAPEDCRGPAVLVDYAAMKREGTHTLYFDGGGGIRIETVAGVRGERPWSARKSSRNKKRHASKAAQQASSAESPAESTGADPLEEP
jgi:competence protein ComEC